MSGGVLDPSLLFDSTTVTFGFTAPDDRATLEELEASGVPHLWVGGHIASPNGSPEVMVRLARLSARTERALIGTSILMLPLYPPAIVAKQISDLDVLTGGRVVLGVGIGGEHPVEYSACQVPVTERGARANASIPLIRRLWTGQPVTDDGRFYPMENVVITKPVRPEGPPILVSGRQDAAMRRAALLGDGWMPYLFSPRRYRASVDRIHELAAEGGRPLDRFAWTSWVYTSVDRDGDKARQHLAGWLGRTYRQDGFEEMLNNVAAAGTVEEVAAKFCQYVDAGVRHFVVAAPAGDVDQRHMLLDEVLPRVREHAVTVGPVVASAPA